MRKTWTYLGLMFGLTLLLTCACLSKPQAPDGRSAIVYDANDGASVMLPIVMMPAATSTIQPPPTPDGTPIMPTPVPTPVPTATLAATSEPLPGNALVNGSFEEGWTDLPPAPGSLINQQPSGWALSWLDIGQPLWNDSTTTAQGIPESLHKLASQLPPQEQPGGSSPLILDGLTTYKMFHFGAPFGSQLLQVISGLPPGSVWRFTVPVQVHIHDDVDPWAAESGVWVLTSATQSGGWTPAGQMGDHVWFYHNVEFSVPADGRVELLVRVKSKWFRAKDFFLDKLELRRLGAGTRPAAFSDKPLVDGQSVTWGPRAWEGIPSDEIVRP